MAYWACFDIYVWRNDEVWPFGLIKVDERWKTAYLRTALAHDYSVDVTKVRRLLRKTLGHEGLLDPTTDPA